MSEQNKISTLFEFTQTGYNEVSSQLDALIAKAKVLRTETKTAATEQADAAEKVGQLTQAYIRLEKAMQSGSTKQQRTELVALKKSLADATAEQARAASVLAEKTKAEQENAKTLKDNEALTENYRRVLAELNKGMDDARVTTDALAKAKKYLSQEMGKTELGTPKYKELSKELGQVNKTLKSVTDSQRAQQAAMDSEGDSVVSLRQKVSQLKAEWSQMSMTSPKFAETSKELATLTDQLKNAEASVGDFRRDVGNYGSVLDKLLPSQFKFSQYIKTSSEESVSFKSGMQAAAAGVKTLGSALKALLANPIVLVLTGVVAVLAALSKGIQSSEQNMAKLNAILAPAKRLFDALLNVVQKFAGTVLDAVGALGKMAMGLSKLAESLPLVGKYFKEVNTEIERSIDLENRKYQLQLDARRLQTEEAAAEAELAELRATAADKEGKSLAERLAANKREAEIVDELYKKKIEQAQAAADLYREEASRADNVAEVNNEQLRLDNEVLAIQRKRAQEQRTIATERTSMITEERAATAAAASEYIAATANQRKAAEELAKAQEEYRKQAALKQTGDAEGMRAAAQAVVDAREQYAAANESLQAIRDSESLLNDKQRAKEEAAEKQHIATLRNIRETGTAALWSAMEKRADSYLKAQQAVSDAEAALLKASANASTAAGKAAVKQYELDLKNKRAALASFYADALILTEEQEQQLQVQQEAHTAEMLSAYEATLQQVQDLRTQLDETAETDAADKLRETIAAYEQVAQTQLAMLQQAGVDTAAMYSEMEDGATRTADNVADALIRSAELMQTFAGETQNVWSRTATATSTLIAKAFDVSKSMKKLDKDTTAGKKAIQDMKNELAALGGAAAATALNAVSEQITANLEQQKAAIEETYATETAIADAAFSEQTASLDRALKNQEISQAEYILARQEAEERKAKADKEREKKKANDLYEIEKKQFRTEQLNSIAQAAIQSALAIIQCYSQLGPIAGAIYSGVVAAMTAAQVAIISSQKGPSKPKFRRGGFIDYSEVDGPSHEDGGVPVVVGGREIAEVEGGEGMFVISRKAMKNPRMQLLIEAVEAENRRMSGAPRTDGKYDGGGWIDRPDYIDSQQKYKGEFDQVDAYQADWWDFWLLAKNNISVNSKQIVGGKDNGKWSYTPTGKNYGPYFTQDLDELTSYMLENEAVWKAVVSEWNAYAGAKRTKLKNRIEEAQWQLGMNIQENDILRELGVSTISGYYNEVKNTDKQKELASATLQAYQTYGNEQIEKLKREMGYDEKTADFDNRVNAVTADLTKAQNEIAKALLLEMRDTGELSADEYLSYLDQIEKGYGATVSDIITLRKKEVEAVKEQIEKQRDSEISAAEEVADFRREALEQMRSEWENDYEKLTQAIIDGSVDAVEAVNKLTGTDLERYREILAIDEQIRRMNDEYAANDALLNDGVIETREERAALLAEQLRLQKEIEEQEAAAEAARTVFEEERAANMEANRKAYELANADALLEAVKELGSALQDEANAWSLDKAITDELNAALAEINGRYDEQIAAQDAVIDGLDAELARLQLIADQRKNAIETERTAFLADFEARKKVIDDWVNQQTSSLQSRLSELNMLSAQLGLAGSQIGVEQYEDLMQQIADLLETYVGKDSSSIGSYATGGAVELGNGWYGVDGPSHASGGVPLSVGGTQIAEVEGVEQLFAVNKRAAHDPAMRDALERASEINERYSGVGFGSLPSDGFALDYERLAMLIGAQINSRPVETFVSSESIARAMRNCDTRKKLRKMS